MPTREELNQLARKVRGEQMARIRAMTREEKYAELNAFYRIGGVFNLDINELKKDQLMQGLSDASLDQAVAICMGLVGHIFQTLPMSADELLHHIPGSDFGRHIEQHFAKIRGLKEEDPSRFTVRDKESVFDRAAKLKLKE